MSQSPEELARAAREAAERALRDAQSQPESADPASRAKPNPKQDEKGDTVVVTRRRRPDGGKR
ncbi:MAG TPA: hypothetical protein VD886_13020 [Herpetosiphonaceae bacterium]|nr:hypothetical protein [Herpetosiphonaceae bacterium]